MAISLKNHEDRITVLEQVRSNNMKVLFNTTFNNATFTPVISENFDNYSYLLVDTNIDKTPGYGATTTLISTSAIKTCGNSFCIGNDDDAVCYFHIADDGRSIARTHGGSNHFYIFKVTGLNL